MIKKDQKYGWDVVAIAANKNTVPMRVWFKFIIPWSVVIAWTSWFLF